MPVGYIAVYAVSIAYIFCHDGRKAAFAKIQVPVLDSAGLIWFSIAAV